MRRPVEPHRCVRGFTDFEFRCLASPFIFVPVSETRLGAPVRVVRWGWLHWGSDECVCVGCLSRWRRFVSVRIGTPGRLESPRAGPPMIEDPLPGERHSASTGVKDGNEYPRRALTRGNESAPISHTKHDADPSGSVSHATDGGSSSRGRSTRVLVRCLFHVVRAEHRHSKTHVVRGCTSSDPETQPVSAWSAWRWDTTVLVRARGHRSSASIPDHESSSSWARLRTRTFDAAVRDGGRNEPLF